MYRILSYALVFQKPLPIIIREAGLFMQKRIEKQYRSEMHLRYPSCISLAVIILEFNRLGIEVLLYHQSHLKGDGVLKLAQIQTRQLADLF